MKSAWLSRAVAGLAAVFSLQAGGQNSPVQTAASHHDGKGFHNLHIDSVTQGLGAFLRWRWEAWRQDLPPPPREPTPVQAPDLPLLNGYAGATQQAATGGVSPAPAVTWIGHATALVQAGGLQVLVDPIFSERASPLSWAGPKRAQPPGLALDALPPIDVVLLSHNHYDHLDRESLVRLHQRSQNMGHPIAFLVPLGLKSLLEQWGIAGVQELDWWQEAPLGNTRFQLTPVQHWSARGLFDRNQTLWGGWAVFAPDLHWFFAGDTGYSPDFAAIRARFASAQTPGLGGGFDLALIPIGAFEPRWFMQRQHVNPAEAVRIHQDLGAQRSMGVHWGTFALTNEPLDQPPRDLKTARDAAGLAPEAFFMLAVGETRVLPPRKTVSATASEAPSAPAAMAASERGSRF